MKYEFPGYGAAERSASRRSAPRAVSVAVLLAAALAAGCAKQNSVVVGAVPDDYRTNHPILVGEQERSVDIPVGLSDYRMSNPQRTALDGFMAGYDHSAKPMVTVMVPAGSKNAPAASAVSAEIVQALRKEGVPEGRILHQPYHAAADEISSPIRVSYMAMTAYTGPCGRWPDDLLDNEANRHYANFGCAYQNNLAAQIANPADLLGPRRPTTIDAAQRSLVIDIYQTTAGEWDSEVDF
jgi:pilus assembly protein CpaD